MLSRRQTTAAATPGPSRLASRAPTATPGPGSDATSIPLPAYQPLEHPLSHEAQDALAALRREFPSDRLTKQFQDSMNALSTHGGIAAEEIYHINNEKAARAKKRAKDGTAEDEDVENAAHAEIERIEKLTSRMEAAVRRAVDGEHNVSSVDRALSEIQNHARLAGSSTQRGRASQPTQTQMSRVTMEPVDGDGDEAMPDATPAPPPSLFPQFEATMQRSTDRYDAQSLAQRYASHPRYAHFKKNVHEGRHGNEAPPLEHPSRWFATSGGAPQPGETRVPGAFPDDAADDDDDLVLARAAVSTKCPLTLREFEKPLTSTRCPHSFEESAILSLLQQARPPMGPRGRPTPMPGWRPNVECPVPGCPQRLERGDLREDQAVIDSIARVKRLERVRREMAEEEDGEEDRGIVDLDDEEMRDDEDADDVDAVHESRGGPTSSRQIKTERRGRGRMEDIEDE